jgi:hypothetical protein
VWPPAVSTAPQYSRPVAVGSFTRFSCPFIAVCS